MVDDLGKAEGLGQIEAAAIRYDQAGNLVAKNSLLHGVYRLGIHPCGRGLIALSKDCVIHSYDDDLKNILQTSLPETPEIVHLRKRFEVRDDQLKNHIRCVALSQKATRYLFTVVDEAWCIDINGNGLWGIKLPAKEGWSQIAMSSKKTGTSIEVEHALAIMNLAFPYTPEDLKRHYRELSKQWHPDLNPGNSQAEEKMKAINLAMDLLTGLDVNSLPRYAGAYFNRDMVQREFEVGGVKFTISMGMQISEIQASDWIYAASFAASTDRVYLAGYSGHVVLVDENGKGIRVYDIGSVPRRIIDTGDYLYLLTDTRLYVLRDDSLHAVIDTYEGGDLFMAQTGFGLLEKNRLRWFREDGHYLGSIVSQDPIRRAYWSEKGLVIESRKKRAIVHGAPKWWE